ncbi:hypothetical protein K470DRAFT_76708 [Piedraia hortae CBS 480.64]|uniref:NADH dehydrogenase [ubiquinone] 1 beta subcomplex subunit 4 n=1 Tax=Piedraia hortae CBS 480.64 TaxID=1314780 RepID=A0A6A7BYW1_9PEZI|nr:hypothetical protein K470DRAFT_76708 [Piedraia hortae CBS 480.64]
MFRPTIRRLAGHVDSLHKDPAFVSYNDMWTNRHNYFRWTPRTTWLSFTYILLVPGSLLYLAYKVEGKYSFRSKWRGDAIANF